MLHDKRSSDRPFEWLVEILHEPRPQRRQRDRDLTADAARDANGATQRATSIDFVREREDHRGAVHGDLVDRIGQRQFQDVGMPIAGTFNDRGRERDSRRVNPVSSVRAAFPRRVDADSRGRRAPDVQEAGCIVDRRHHGSRRIRCECTL